MAVHLPGTVEARELAEGLRWPDEFLIGVATAGYQCEGGYNIGDGPRNNWAEWESRPGNERTGACARFWEMPERDLDLARGLGLNAFRMSIEWARLQPIRVRRLLPRAPAWDWAALDRYADIIRMARERELEPVITLHHFTHPYWVGHDLWIHRPAMDQFVEYVSGLIPALTERLAARGQGPIRYWLTINEPTTLAPASYLGKWLPSGQPLDLGSPGRMMRAFDGMYATHVRVYNAVHRAYVQLGLQRPLVSINNVALDFYEADRLFIDVLLSRARKIPFGLALSRDLEQRARAHAEALARVIGHARRSAPERWFAARGFRAIGPRLVSTVRMPLTEQALAESDWERPLDFLAIDYYDPMLANQLKMAAGTYEPWEWECFPEGLHDMLRAYASDGLPILIAENGMSVRRPVGEKPDPRPDGVSRDEFIRANLFHALRAMKSGVPLLGYLHWSLTDNYEWGRFSPRFGLYGVDFQHEERTRFPVDAAGVDSASAYGAIARAIRARSPEALASALSGG